MIKCGDKLEGKPQCILYSKDGSKVLGRFPYSKHGGEKGAKAAAHKREGQIQFFKKKALAVAADKHGAVEVMKFLADQVGCDKVAETIEKAKGWVPPPKGWTPASLAKYWKSMGGTVTACMKKAEGHVDDTAKFCASLKDRVTGKTAWRGKGKAEKSFEEEAEEALSMLQKEQTEPNEDKTNLDELLDDVSLKDLEAWLAGMEKPEEPAAPKPEPQPEPEPTPKPEPDSASEELQEVLREFDEEPTFRNLIKWRLGGGNAPVLEEE